MILLLLLPCHNKRERKMVDGGERIMVPRTTSLLSLFLTQEFLSAVHILKVKADAATVGREKDPSPPKEETTFLVHQR